MIFFNRPCGGDCGKIERKRGRGIIREEERSVPVWEKSMLTLKEAAQYLGIGINKLRELTNAENCPYVLFVGNKRMIKRRVLDTYLEQAFSI